MLFIQLYLKGYFLYHWRLKKILVYREKRVCLEHFFASIPQKHHKQKQVMKQWKNLRDHRVIFFLTKQKKIDVILCGNNT